MELAEPSISGCDGSLIAVPNRNKQHQQRSKSSIDSDSDEKSSSLVAPPPRIFFAEPAGPGERISLRVWCSVDAGVSWKAFVGINQGDGAGYSALEYVADDKDSGGGSGEAMLVVVWEGSVDSSGKPAHASTGTMFSHRLAIDDWCPELV